MFMWTRNHNPEGKDLEILQTLVELCIQMYFKLYFEISINHLQEDGPYHILTELRILRNLPTKMKNIITPYIKTGAWYKSQ